MPTLSRLFVISLFLVPSVLFAGSSKGSIATASVKGVMRGKRVSFTKALIRQIPRPTKSDPNDTALSFLFYSSSPDDFPQLEVKLFQKHLERFLKTKSTSVSAKQAANAPSLICRIDGVDPDYNQFSYPGSYSMKLELRRRSKEKVAYRIKVSYPDEKINVRGEFEINLKSKR